IRGDRFDAPSGHDRYNIGDLDGEGDELQFNRIFPVLGKKLTYLYGWWDEPPAKRICEEERNSFHPGLTALASYRLAFFYDSQIAQHGVRHGWTDQDLADVIVFRRQKQADFVTAPFEGEGLPHYVALVISKARADNRSFIFEQASDWLGIAL